MWVRREEGGKSYTATMAEADIGWRLGGLALAWLVGVALQLQQRALWPTPWWPVGLLLGAVGLAVAWRWRRAWPVALLAVALLGASTAEWRASARLADTLASAIEGRDVAVTGIVANLPQQSASGLRFRFEVESARLDGRAVEVPHAIALGWYKGWHEDAVLSQPQRTLRAGQRWRFTVRLRQPHGNFNPHGFDYELM